MECFYSIDLTKNVKKIAFLQEEINHQKVLRLQDGDKIMVTNGLGLSAIGTLEIISKKHFFNVIEVFENLGEIDCNITIGFGILSIKDRNEFLIEKCVELGVKAIQPLYTRFVQNKNFNKEKFQLKVITATKQSKRSFVPIVNNSIELPKIKNMNFDLVLLADESGSVDVNLFGKKILLLVGPEGGFSETELLNIEKYENLQKINLGPSRLRAETAAINLLSIVRQKFI